MMVAARVVSGNHDRRFLGLHQLAWNYQDGAVIVQPGPLKPHWIAPTQAGVESHQDELAQPRGCCFHQSSFLLVGEPAHAFLPFLIERDATERSGRHPIPAQRAHRPISAPRVPC